MDKKYYTDPPKIWAIALWLLFCSVAVLWVFSAPGKAEREPIKWLYIVFLGCFCLMYVRWYWNYPILQEDYLVIQNVLLCSSKFRYSDIEHATITNAGRGNLLSIKLRHKRFARHITISCVHDNNLDHLAVDLQQKGVNTIRKMSPFD